ncbi:MAG: ChbG/HpnK family deacetylase [Chthoniobacterales bacterium]
MTRLLITGDDFGSSHAVNEAVEAQYQAGRLSQASLMIHGREVAEAKRIAQRHPGLCVGLHLTLCAGSRVGRTGLTDAQGNFEPSPAVAGVRYQWNSRLRRAIRAEIEEQFGQFLAEGFPPVYWDGHTHLHLHPVVFGETLPVAKAHGFGAVRLVQTENAGFLGWIFNRLSQSARRQLGGIQHAERTFGLRETGCVDDASFIQMQQRAAAAGLAEIYYHPGVDGPARAELDSALRLTNWQAELASVDGIGESR